MHDRTRHLNSTFRIGRGRGPWARALALPLVVLLAAFGCGKGARELMATRDGSVAIDTLSDYEVARSIAFAGLGQFEGMHELAPDNEDALFLLTQGWVGYGFGYPEDEWEQAVDRNDDDAADYQKMSGVQTYSASGMAICALTFDVSTPPFDDLHVRKAIAYACDREGYVRAFLGGNGMWMPPQP